MLKAEDAQVKLEELRRPDWVENHAGALKQLPGVQAWMRFRLADDGSMDHAQKAEAFAFRVSAYSDTQRRELFETLFPKLADAMERAWQGLANVPIQFYSYETTAFRMPRHTVRDLQMRDEWVRRVIEELKGLDPDPAWLAAWGGHMGYGGVASSSRVLAAAIDAGGKTGDEVFEILKQIASNRHEVGVMSGYVIKTLLVCGRPEAWEFLGQLLLAAQRQEGLRQWILEWAHGGHPGAFRRLLGVILDENLVRFTATVRAIDVWFGFMWDSMSTGHAKSIVERVVALLDDPKARASAIAGKDAETAYLGLWCEAHFDAEVASKRAAELLRDKSPEKRWVGVHTLATIGLPEAIGPVTEALGDDDLRVAARALDALWILRSSNRAQGDSTDPANAKAKRAEVKRAVFDQLEKLLKRCKGKEEKFKPLVFPWGRTKLSATEIGDELVEYCPPACGERLIALLGRLGASARADAASLIAGHTRTYDTDENKPELKQLATLARTTLIAMLGDPAVEVREQAALWLQREAVSDEEVARHEELCDRTASDVRTRALSRLESQSDASALASAERLLNGSKLRALAGLDLLRLLVEKDRSREAATALAEAFRKENAKPGKDAQAALDAIFVGRSRATVTVKDAFGLAKAFAPRAVPTLQPFARFEATPAAVACLWSLDDLVEANKLLELKAFNEDGVEQTPFGGERWLLGSLSSTMYLTPKSTLTPEKDRPLCPVTELLEGWLVSRPRETRDADGLELVRAWLLLKEAERSYESSKVTWPSAVGSLAPKGRSGFPRYSTGIELFLVWALRLSHPDAMTFFLDQIEGAIARDDIVRPEDVRYNVKKSKLAGLSAKQWLGRFRFCTANWPRLEEAGHIRRLDGLLRAADLALVEAAKKKPPMKSDDESYSEDPRRLMQLELDEFLVLWHAGDISDDELLIRIMVPEKESEDLHSIRLDELSRLFELRKPGKRSRWERIRLTPRLEALLERIRRRVLEIELGRGDAHTPATVHVLSLDPSGGIDAVVPALTCLGKLKLVRGYLRSNFSKSASFSTIIRASRPGSEDTPAAFAAAAKAAGLSHERLVELALYQPNWAEHVEHATGWKGLEAAVLWLRSHTKEAKDYDWFDDEQEAWEGKAAELTPIAPASLSAGAVDRAWFRRSYEQLGAKRWDVLYDAAKYASGGTGHTRAKLFADAMLGKVTEKELTTRVTTKRHQDAARALGLLDLKSGDAGRKQILARFKTLQEMRRTSRKHGGSMLQASEKRAVEIGMENLAWTAGYPDPLRLQWAMEIEEFGDLAKGPVVVKVGETSVTLAVDDAGEVSLTASKGGKGLKSVPPAVKKDKRVAPLAERVTTLRRQRTRIRQALEQSMCRGDAFQGGELGTLFGHPMLRSQLSRLVMIGTTKAGGKLLGYPDKQGKALRGVDGKMEPVKASDTLRIAHPLDLLATKRWHDWQAECFRTERVQPFKQVFREVYTPIPSETAKGAMAGGDRSARYAGQQVQPRQALALLGARGWVARPEEGVQRTFHQEQVTVRVEFEEGFYSPAQIDGLTLAGVSFMKAGTQAPVAVHDVPGRVFSETMRDLDLVVSVAHRGGVDPEASQSTVEMRGSLLRETCSLLSLGNVRVENSRAIIKGELGEYALHLGSGTIHKLPGGTIWVVPVHSQHRGRVFLPFGDDDPKTAEVISKALLLARDREIQDPGILAQIRG